MISKKKKYIYNLVQPNNHLEDRIQIESFLFYFFNIFPQIYQY